MPLADKPIATRLKSRAILRDLQKMWRAARD